MLLVIFIALVGIAWHLAQGSGHCLDAPGGDEGRAIITEGKLVQVREGYARLLQMAKRLAETADDVDHHMLQIDHEDMPMAHARACTPKRLTLAELRARARRVQLDQMRARRGY